MPSETTTDPASGATGGGPTLSGDWAGQVTGKVEDVVSIIRDKTVRPVERGVQYLVFALLAGFVGLLVLCLFAIFALRVLDTEVPVFRSRVWASYLVLAGIFWIGGLLLSKMRRPRT